MAFNNITELSETLSNINITKNTYYHYDNINDLRNYLSLIFPKNNDIELLELFTNMFIGRKIIDNLIDNEIDKIIKYSGIVYKYEPNIFNTMRENIIMILKNNQFKKHY